MLKCNPFDTTFPFSGATTTDLPPGVLYRVKATYKYVREDVDELSFEVGDTINVIEYEDPEDQVRFAPLLGGCLVKILKKKHV